MKRALAVALTLAFAVGMFAAPAMAGDKAVQHAFGKMIKAQCTAFYAMEEQAESPYFEQKVAYGKLWRMVKKESSHAGFKPSAQRFVRSGQLDAHCPIADLKTAGGKGKGNAFGKLIKVQCTSFYAMEEQAESPYFEQKVAYGKLWRMVKKESSHAGFKPSAKRFVRSGQLDAHCPVAAVPA